MKRKTFNTVVTGILALVPALALAHPQDYDFSGLSRADVGLIYLKLGFEHILPLGLDHILFVVCIFLLNPDLKKVIWQATAFTVAHSITLGLALYGWISAPTDIVEPVIALSIVLVALENVLTRQLHPWRLGLVFLFGLVHGLGFASVLTGLGLPEKEYLTALLSFNVGVEFGQITVILICYVLLGIWFSSKAWYHNRVVIPLSILIACVALFWTVERTWSVLG